MQILLNIENVNAQKLLGLSKMWNLEIDYIINDLINNAEEIGYITKLGVKIGTIKSN